MDIQTFHTLENAILRTVAYFDVFNYPLTLPEIQNWLHLPKEEKGEKVHLADLLEVIHQSDVLADSLSSFRAFYFLTGRESIVKERLHKYTLAERKFKKALQYSKVAKHFPYIRMIAICNTLGYSNASQESDIDFFIIASHGHLWTSRLWTVFLADALGLRPTEKSKQDKLCFSFFLSDRSLNLSNIRISESDIYLPYWVASLTPLYDQGGYYEAFLRENQWIRDSIPFHQEYRTLQPRKIAHGAVTNALKGSIEWIQDGFWEPLYQKIQRRILPKNLHNIPKENTGVVLDRNMLKFHDEDRRDHFRQEWTKRLELLGVTELLKKTT